MYRVNREIVEGILGSRNQTKQKLGQRFANLLGFEPGPLGADGGVDGKIKYDGKKYYFQSKLNKSKLGPVVAGKVFSDMRAYSFQIGVVLSGVGFTSGFEDRIERHENDSGIEVKRLTLMDVVSESNKYNRVVNRIPPLVHLQDVSWKDFQD